jgi:hypothetical protein
MMKKISTTMGAMLKSMYLNTWAKEEEPLLTILMIFPVSLERWNAKL